MLTRHSYLYPIYTIQPVVSRLYNRFDNRVEGTATVRSTVLNEQPLFVQPVVKPTWQLVWQPVWQPVVSCIQTF